MKEKEATRCAKIEVEMVASSGPRDVLSHIYKTNDRPNTINLSPLDAVIVKDFMTYELESIGYKFCLC